MEAVVGEEAGELEAGSGTEYSEVLVYWRQD